MFKRKKDGGFTLIELMIVIAVIGILAVVLMPKMSSVKDTAKASGVITNAKSVEAYVVANISKWENGSSTPVTAIKNQFTTSAKDQLKNPYTDATGDTAINVGDSTTAPSPGKGTVTVLVGANLASDGITITAYGASASDKVYEQTIYK